MPRIPVYTPRVQPTTPNIPEQRIPTAPAEAFGGGVAQAGASISKVLDPITKIFADRAEEVRKLDNQVFASNVNSAFLNDMTNRLYSDKEETVVVNGVKVKRPSGILNRTFDKADGSVKDYQEWYFKRRAQYLQTVRDPDAQFRLAQSMDSAYQSNLNNIIKHQVEQKQKHRVNSQMDLIKSKQDAFASVSPDRLMTAIDDLETDVSLLADIEDKNPQEREKMRQDNIQTAVERTLQSVMMADPTGKAAKKTISLLEDRISEDRKRTMRELVENQVKTNQENFKAAQISNEIQLFSDIFSGKQSIEDIPIGTLSVSGDIRKETADALTSFRERGDDLIGTDEDEIFLSTLNSAFSAGTPEELNAFVMDVLEKSKNTKDGINNMAILFKAAQDFSGNREVQLGARTTIKAAIDAGLDGGAVGRDYIDAINTGLKPSEARDKVLQAHGIQPDGEPISAAFGPSGSVPQAANSGGFFKRYVDVNVAGFKGLASMIASTPQAMGALMKEYGEAPEENGNFWKDIITVPFTFGKQIAEQVPALRNARLASKDAAVTIGESMIDSNREWILKQGLTRPEAGLMNQLAFDLSAGAGSLGMSVGIALLSKNPIASASFFGVLQKGRIYQEAREAGLFPEEASQRSTVAGAVEGGIELIGLNWLLRNSGGRIMNAVSKSFGNSLSKNTTKAVDAFVQASGQAVEEGLQSISEDTIADWRNKGGMEKLMDAGYSMALGFILGGSASVVLDINTQQNNINELKKAGLTEEQAQDVIVETAEGIADEINTISQETEAELQRANERERLIKEFQQFKESDYVKDITSRAKEARGEKEPLKFPNVRPELQGLAEEAQAFKTAEEFAADRVPDESQVLARKFFTGFYKKVSGKTTEQQAIPGEPLQETVQSTAPRFEEAETAEVTPITRPTVQPKDVLPTGERKKSRAYERAVKFYELELRNQPEAQYSTINIADQMARAFEFIDQEPVISKKVAYGIQPAPAGIRETAVSIAYNNKMLEEGNYEEFGRSYRSRSLRQSLRGQEIVLEKAADVNINDPIHFIKQVINARMAQAGQKIFDVKLKKEAPVRKAIQRIKTEVAKVKTEVVSKKDIDIIEAQKIIDSLAC